MIECLGDLLCSKWGCCESGSDKKGEMNWWEADNRFIKLSSSVEMKICKGFVPKNMQTATKLAVRVFEEWRVGRNKT